MAADLSRSRAVSEADSYKETLDQQFTKQVYEYKVRMFCGLQVIENPISTCCGCSICRNKHNSMLSQ